MPQPEKAFLSPAQKRIVAAGGTALAAVFLIATCFFLFVLLRQFVSAFTDVLLPLAIAAILATLLRPLITFCETRTRLNRVGGILLLYLLVILALGAITVFCLPAILTQAGDFLQELPELSSKLLEYFKGVAPGIWSWLTERLGQSPEAYIQELMAENSDMIKQGLGRLQSSAGSMLGFIGGIFGKIAAYSIIPVYLFFILNGDRDIWKDLQKQLNFLPNHPRDDLIFLGRQFSEILVSFFRGQIIIGLLLGLVLAVGFGLVGLKFGIVLGFALGLLNIIPYLGTMLGIVTVLPLAYFQEDGSTTLIVLCAVVFGIGQILTDYVFTPKVMGDKTGMGPMLLIFSVFFWGTALGGLLGMILAIPLTAFFLVFWRLARDKYLPSLTAKKEIEAAQ
ncbi:MAG: AI-2E family transporter [Opitutales bacterium]|jgi:predicted PurR-regulated permease PerM|nr:AI-2E family transporter [Opitutales bacterium]MDP4776834.1 AI-2E family transporter [Opitutales bacterium]MDP4883268.1 AI-2E family transporter [Opitutales bacterium]MDP5080076.1 AI-2E family transporter [Opitutales bacterium]